MLEKAAADDDRILMWDFNVQSYVASHYCGLFRVKRHSLFFMFDLLGWLAEKLGIIYRQGFECRGHGKSINCCRIETEAV